MPPSSAPSTPASPYGWYYYLGRPPATGKLWIAGFLLSTCHLLRLPGATAVTPRRSLVRRPGQGRERPTCLLLRRNLRALQCAALRLACSRSCPRHQSIEPVALYKKKGATAGSSGRIYRLREAGLHFVGVAHVQLLGWCCGGGDDLRAAGGWSLGQSGKEKAGRVANSSLPLTAGAAHLLGGAVFNITIAFIIGERLVGLTAIFIFVLPIAITTICWSAAPTATPRRSWPEHLRDFPWSPASGRKL